MFNTEEYDSVTIAASGIICENNGRIIKIIRPKDRRIEITQDVDAITTLYIEERKVNPLFYFERFKL